jgi:S1-C subfamily serine protease
LNLLDVIIVIFCLAALGNGYRRGFSLSAFSYVGLVAGTALGALLAPPIERAFSAGPSTAPFIGLGILFITASVGSSVGHALGEPLRVRLLQNRERGDVDSVAGAGFGVIAVLATAWFLGLAFVRGPLPPVSGEIQRSAILRSLDSFFPRPPGFLTGVGQILAAVPYPQVFDTLNPNLQGPVHIDQSVANNEAVKTAGKETVKIRSLGCGGEVFGSGFPVGGDYIISNAHVVAGTADHTVYVPDGRVLRGTVVLFDSDRDVSILHVPDLHLTPLHMVSAQRGTSGATIGYPGGGDETINAAAVRDRVTAVGRDIYGSAEVARDIYVLSADIRPGNSGGPLVDGVGDALGLVFANSTTDPTEGYALTTAEVTPDVRAGVGQTAAVSTQACAS